MRIIDNTNPKHVLCWEHLDNADTIARARVRFFCTCREWEMSHPSPATLPEAETLQSEAIFHFNSHIAMLTPADPTAPTDAVIISETKREPATIGVTEITFLHRKNRHGVTIEGSDPRSDESFWRDPNTGERVNEDPSGWNKTQNFGGYPSEEARSANPNAMFGKFGKPQPYQEEMLRRMAEATTIRPMTIEPEFDTAFLKRAFLGTKTTNVHVEVDGKRMIDNLRDISARLERDYPHLKRRR